MITAMDTRNITFEENYVIIRIGNLLKTTYKKHHTGEVKLPHFPSNKNMSSLLSNKISWCNKTEEKQYYFTVYNHIKVVQTNIKRHCDPMDKKILAAAGIDVKLFTSHSTRSAANSKAKLHVLIETILRTASGAVCIHLQNIMINQ